MIYAWLILHDLGCMAAAVVLILHDRPWWAAVFVFCLLTATIRCRSKRTNP